MFGFEEVFQSHDLSLLFLGPPRHRVTCVLIPLAVLKHDYSFPILKPCEVTCVLIPLAVLKLEGEHSLCSFRGRHMCPHTACGIETCGALPWERPAQEVTCVLIPLAVLKLQKRLTSTKRNSLRHMCPHTACGIETKSSTPSSFGLSGHMCPHTACGIETPPQEPFL